MTGIATAPPAPPGELTQIPGVEYHPTSRITLIDFQGDHFIETVVQDPKECFQFAATDTVTWINVEGLGDVETIRRIGEAYHLHPLALEDVLHVHQRPKLEEYEDFLFIVLRELRYGERLETEQISLFLGKNYLITFQETPGDPFDGVRERLRKGRPKLRSSGTDYLAYALLDAVVDSYFPVLDAYNDRLETLEDEASEDPRADLPRRIQAARRDLVELRTVVWSTRELLAHLLRVECDIISRMTVVYLRDVHDHTVAAMEVLETYREMAAGLRDIYFSRLSVRTNEIMKALTLIATVFMPLTFLTGVYGMNVDLPGKDHPATFWVFIGVMALIGASMVVWFRRKRWI